MKDMEIRNNIYSVAKKPLLVQRNKGPIQPLTQFPRTLSLCPYQIVNCIKIFLSILYAPLSIAQVKEFSLSIFLAFSSHSQKFKQLKWLHLSFTDSLKRKQRSKAGWHQDRRVIQSQGAQYPWLPLQFGHSWNVHQNCTQVNAQPHEGILLIHWLISRKLDHHIFFFQVNLKV